MYTGSGKGFADPYAIVTHFHLREGDLVADFGAGSGHYMKPLSEAVGKNGKIYLCEIQRTLVEALGIKAQESHSTNVYPIWCDIESKGGTKLRDGELDGVMVSNTLFQFTNKESALQEIARVARKGAKFFVIDWTDSFGGIGPQPKDVIREDDAKVLVERAGFTFDRSFPAGDHHYGLAFRRK